MNSDNNTVKIDAQYIAEQKQRNDSLFNQDYIAIAVLRGHDYVIEQANDLVCQIWGRTQKDVLNKPILKALPELEGQGVDELLQGVMDSGVSYTGKELPVILKRSGRLETIYFDFIYVPMLDESKTKITGITVMAVDITNQVISKAKLAESEKRYRMLIDQSPLSIQILTPDGHTTQVNKTWEKLWGLKLSQLKGYNMLEDQQLVEQGIMPYIKKGFEGAACFIPPARYEPAKTIKGADDDLYRWVQAFIYPIKDEKGGIQEVVLMHQDVTDLKKSEEKAAKLFSERTELEALNKAKDEFIAVASHQLRTPATAVKQFLGIALQGYDGELSPEIRRVIDQANISNERQINIIEELLKVAHVDAGNLHLQKKSVLLQPLIQEVIDSNGSAFDIRQQAVSFTALSEDVTAEIDAEKIRMVLENIIDNASKYTPENKNITITLSKNNKEAIITIQDEGVGIAKKDMEKLFVKFSRIDNPLSIRVGGNGLGLYWAHKIVQLHKGNITVSSTSGKGSSFIISLPLSTAE